MTAVRLFWSVQRRSMPPVASTTNNAERRPIEFSAAPTSRIFVAICIAGGGAIFAACFLFGLGEVLVALKRHVLEGLFAQGGR